MPSRIHQPVNMLRLPDTVEEPAPEPPGVAEAAAPAVQPVVREPVALPISVQRAEGTRARAVNRGAPATRLARLGAAGGLALFLLTIIAFVVTGTRGQPLPRADMLSFEQRLTGYDHDVRAQLSRLGPPGSVARARLRTREALAATEVLADQLRDYRGAAATRLRAAAAAQLRYLDAVGSTLVNPRSPLRAQLSARASVARTALAALDRR